MKLAIANRSGKTRNLLAGLALLGSTASLVIGSTFALFSDTESSASNTFETKTVTVANSPTSTVCTVNTLMPGDSSTNFGSGSAAFTPCTYNVEYTGTADAWLAVDVLVTSGSTALYTGESTGLQLKIGVDGGVTVINGVNYKTIAGVDTLVDAGTSVNNLLLSATPAAQNDAIQFNIDYLLPTLAPNLLQGGSASVTLTFHAVQSANQPIGSCVAGQQCNTITWS